MKNFWRSNCILSFSIGESNNLTRALKFLYSTVPIQRIARSFCFIRYIGVPLYRSSEIYGRREIGNSKFVLYIEVLTRVRHIGVLLYLGLNVFISFTIPLVQLFELMLHQYLPGLKLEIFTYSVLTFYDCSCLRGRYISTTNCVNGKPSSTSSVKSRYSRIIWMSLTTRERCYNSWWMSTTRPPRLTTSTGVRSRFVHLSISHVLMDFHAIYLDQWFQTFFMPFPPLEVPPPDHLPPWTVATGR